MSATITTLDGVHLAEIDAGDDNPDAAVYRAVELAGEHGSVVLEDNEGLYRVYSCGHMEDFGA